MYTPPFFNCHNCHCHTSAHFNRYFSLFLYQVLQCPHQFVCHVGGILGNAEPRARVYRSEVRVVGAVVAAGDCDVLALVDVRVALHSLLVSGLNG